MFFNFNCEQKNFDEIILNINIKYLKDLQDFWDRLYFILIVIDKLWEQDGYWLF